MRRSLPALLLGLGVLILIGWGAGAWWTSVVGSGELSIVREVAEGRSAELTSVFRAVTWAGSAFVLVPLALACGIALVRLGLRREAAAVALSLGGAMLISDVVKLLVARPRPPVEHLQAVTGSSFPSGHATQASAFWLSLVLAMRAAGVAPTLTRLAAGLAVVLVLGVAFSRVYLGVHYPSDVIAGALLGAAWAIWVARCVGFEALPEITVGRLMSKRLNRFDRRMIDLSRRLRSPGLNGSLIALGRAANYSRLWLSIAGLLAVFGGERGRRAAARGLEALAIAAAVANGPAKLLVRRRRPPAGSHPTLIGMPSSTSFPSGHSASAAAFATAASDQWPALAPVLAPLAAAVAYSRVHTGVHFPSDVAAGIAIGVGAGVVVRRRRASPPGGEVAS